MSQGTGIQDTAIFAEIPNLESLVSGTGDQDPTFISQASTSRLSEDVLSLKSKAHGTKTQSTNAQDKIIQDKIIQVHNSVGPNIQVSSTVDSTTVVSTIVDDDGALQGTSYRLGKLYYEKGDFEKAILCFRSHLASKKSSPDEHYLDLMQMLIRIFAEREDNKEIENILTEIDLHCQNFGIHRTSRFHYTLGVCEFYRRNFPEAEFHFVKSLQLALDSKHLEDQCYARTGWVHCLMQKGEPRSALKEIEETQKLMEDHSESHSLETLHNILISLILLKAKIVLNDGNFEEAKALLWKAFERVKVHKTLTLHISVSYHLGLVYFKSQELSLARVYFELALKMTDPVNFVHLYKEMEATLKEWKLGDLDDSWDLFILSDEKKVIDRLKGTIDFNNQFLLMDLLEELAANQGKVYTKEDLIGKVWKAPYDPQIHDNKLYVNIKRLRKLIEPSDGRPKYIVREKKGYTFSRSMRIKWKKRGAQDFKESTDL